MNTLTESGRMSRTVCKLCRQRKTRCNRQLPECDSCLRAGVNCQYVKDKSRPGLRAGYVSALEERLNILEKEVQLLKVDRCPHATIVANRTNSNENPSPALIVEAQSGLQISHDQLSPPGIATTVDPRQLGPLQFDPLWPSVLDELCAVWFEKYHPWFPILHQPSLLEALQASADVKETPYLPILKAIVAVTIIKDFRSEGPSKERCHQISDELRNQVVMEAINNLSLGPLQAVLILCILEYGAGRLKEHWNLVALAKRMAIQLGLRDLVAHHCSNFNRVSTLPPRMLPIPESLVDREEKIRAYWMAEVLDGASTVGAAWNISISRPENDGLLPCSDAAWAFPEAVISAWPFDDLAMSSAYSLYVMLITNEVYHAHHFLQKSYDLQRADERARRRADCQTVDEGLKDWRARFDASQLQLDPTIENHHDPNSTLIRCVLDLATISIYQGLIFPPLEGTPGTWHHALRRCLEACDSMTNLLQEVEDTDLENISPLIIPCIFVAARFCILHAKIFDIEPSHKIAFFPIKLEVCGRRWPYARRLLKVLRTAVASYDPSNGIATTLPIQFYDFMYAYLDIDEALRIWAESSEI
ncbi:hypothetical protein P171DRAFT_436741 [Karstenula rhodostoma CBS 690.94]|uniref:Zn(2)-C6 fungal-type domain-containing protein n=1 Tax=Karstenula rhodostoma CBS 690.94 TaxID=1392251 RepID=A0A9P4U7A1_9PLEO|nr:hypothetical protein P171DRAFT_436741 [Karstenula rhodostoma CBS 690.94]